MTAANGHCRTAVPHGLPVLTIFFILYLADICPSSWHPYRHVYRQHRRRSFQLAGQPWRRDLLAGIMWAHVEGGGGCLLHAHSWSALAW